MEQVDQLEWADKAYKIEDLINDVQLPCLVKVCAGIYNENEDESFSTDDIIKLDSCWWNRKVKCYLAEYVHSGEKVNSGHSLLQNQPGSTHIFKQTSPPAIISTHGAELTIAIKAISTLLQIRSVNGERCVYYGVSDLIEFFPRYVKIATPLYVSSTIYLDINVMLELIKTEDLLTGGTKCLVVKLESGMVVKLPKHLQGQFCHVNDETWYTLSDVVSRFPLPQFVKLKNTRELKRLLKTEGNDTQPKFPDVDHLILTSTSQEGFVVGHHKVYDGLGEAESGYVFTLPLNSEVLQDLEFLVADNVDTDDYQIALSKYFTKEINIDEIKKNMYDYANDAKQIVKLTDANCPNLYLKKGLKEFTKDDEENEDNYENMNFYDKVCDNISDQAKPTSTESDDDEYEDMGQLRTGPRCADGYERVWSSGESAAIIKPKIFKKVPPAVPPKPSVYEDVEPKSPRYVRVPTVRIPRSSTKTSSAISNTTTSKVRPTLSFSTMSRQTVEKSGSMKSPSKDIPAPPAAKPKMEVSPFSVKQNVISDLSVGELSDRLHQCGLQELGEKCQEDCIDGDFFCSLSVDDLKQEFSLSRISLKKVEKLKEGWLPKM